MPPSVATQPKVRTRRTASKEVRRRQLIDATIQSIATYGLSGTTMTTVTRIANLSLGIVSFHFQSKENLLVETLAYLAEEHRSYWRLSQRDESLSPERKLLALVDAHFHPNICTKPKISVWYAFFGDAYYRDLYRRRISGIDDERADVTERLCRAIKESGRYENLDLEEVVNTLESLYDGIWLNLLVYPEQFDPEDARGYIISYLAQVFPQHFERLPKRASPMA